MTSPALPRPWFISFTAKWSEAEGFEALQEAVNETLKRYPLPFYHLPVAPSSWHSTVFAALAVRDIQPDGRVPSSLVNEFFSAIAAIPGLLEPARDLLPLSVQPLTLACFDNATTVQFSAPDRLATHRDGLRPLLQQAISGLCVSYHGVQSLLNDPDKSGGAAFFGSVARSADRTDGNHLRWQTTLPPLPPLTFRSLLLVVSDDALTNVHTHLNSRRVSLG